MALPNPLSVLPAYQRARWGAQAGPTHQEIAEERQFYYRALGDLAKLEADLKRSSYQAKTSLQAAIWAAQSRAIAVFGDFANAAGMVGAAQVSAYERLIDGYADLAAKAAMYDPDPEVLKNTREAMGEGDAPLAKSFTEGGAGARVNERLDAQDDQGAYVAFKGWADAQGVDRATGQILASKSRLPPAQQANAAIGALGEVAAAVRTAVGFDNGPHAEKLDAFADRYERELLDPNGATLQKAGVGPEDIAKAQRSSADGKKFIDDHLEAILGMAAGGDATLARRLVADAKAELAKVDAADGPPASASPEFIAELRRDYYKQIDDLGKSQDPYEQALSGFINRFRIAGGGDPVNLDDPHDPWFAFVAATRFKGKHRYDKAALWAAQHGPEVKTFLEQAKKDPSLVDFSNPQAIERSREVLRAAHVPTRGIERTTGIHLPGQKPEDPGGTDLPPQKREPEPEQPRIAPAGPAATAATQAPGAAATSEESVADAKPGPGGRPRARDEFYMESGWTYALNPKDESIKILTAPRGHERAITPTPLTEGDAYEAIIEHIKDGRAKPFGPAKRTTIPENPPDIAGMGVPRRNHDDAATRRADEINQYRRDDEWDEETIEPKDKPVEPATVEPEKPAAKPITPAKNLVRGSLSAHTSAQANGTPLPQPNLQQELQLRNLLQATSDPAAKAIIQKQLDSVSAVNNQALTQQKALAEAERKRFYDEQANAFATPFVPGSR